MVADIVAVSVVDAFEKVDVEHDDGNGHARSSRLRDGFFHRLVEFPAVEAFRQRVELRELDGACHFQLQRAREGDEAALLAELFAEQREDEVGESQYGKRRQRHEDRNQGRNAQGADDPVQDRDERQHDARQQKGAAVHMVGAFGTPEAENVYRLQDRHAEKQDGHHDHEPVLVREEGRQREFKSQERRQLQREGGGGNQAVRVDRLSDGGTEFPVHDLYDDERAADGHQINRGQQQAPPKPRLVPKEDRAVARAEQPERGGGKEEEGAPVKAAQLALVHVIDADDGHEHEDDGQIDEVGQVEKEQPARLVGVRTDGDACETPEVDGRFGVHLEGDRMPDAALVRRQRDEMPAPAVADLLVSKRAVLIDQLVVLPDAEGLVHRDEKERVDVGRGGVETHAQPNVVRVLGDRRRVLFPIVGNPVLLVLRRWLEPGKTAESRARRITLAILPVMKLARLGGDGRKKENGDDEDEKEPHERPRISHGHRLRCRNRICRSISYKRRFVSQKGKKFLKNMFLVKGRTGPVR